MVLFRYGSTTCCCRYSIVNCMCAPGQPCSEDKIRSNHIPTRQQRSGREESTYKEDELAGLVELLQANPVLGVDGLLLHGKQVLDVADLVVAEPLADLGHNRHIILESASKAQSIESNGVNVTSIILDQDKVVEGDEVVLVCLVLHLALVVDVSKEGVVGQVLLTRHTCRLKQMYISQRNTTNLIVKRGAEVLGLHRQIAHILVIHSEEHQPKPTVSDTVCLQMQHQCRHTPC